MTYRDDARAEAVHHYVQLTVESGELHRAFVCTAPGDADCRRRPEGFEEGMCESWTAQEATKAGYPCWAMDWVEAVGIEDAIAASPDGVLASVPVRIRYSEGVEVEVIEQADRAPSDAEVRAEALREFAAVIPDDVYDPRDIANLARIRADQIEKETGA